jgi:hypothetical protein
VTAGEEPEEEEIEGENELVQIKQHKAPAKSGTKEPASSANRHGTTFT